MNFTNKQYDVLKWLAQIALPALGTLYAALSGIWGLPFSKEIVATIIALDAFLGIFLQLSTADYEANQLDAERAKVLATVHEMAEVQRLANEKKNFEELGK